MTITPGRAAGTAAGTGTVGYSGDSGAATAATLASPSAVAYDSSGDLFIADANNHVVREVLKSNGVIATVAGTGEQGFGGDGGAATSALLDTPTGVAVDGSGNLFIADSHNNRIRKVSGGTITTVAGTGAAGFGGDGTAATSALLDTPMAVAVDGSGNLFIADTNNQRIREVSGGNITTIAGDGEELFAGDGGAATAASLDSPTGVAVDGSGNVYIADSHNQRIREVSGGNIATVAGSGAVSFAGDFGGDGSSATSALLARPTGVAVGPGGSVYVADTDNQRIRQVGGGAITTIAGTGEQAYAGDGGAATSAAFDVPRSVGVDSNGNVAIADTNNEAVRSAAEPQLSFGNQPVGVASTAQSITLSNTGSGSLSVTSASLSGSFSAVSGGSCPATPITLASSASCTLEIAFLPTTAASASGSLFFTGSGVVPQRVLLSGTGVQAATVTQVASNLAAALVGQQVTFTAAVTTAGSVQPTGTVTFFDGSTQVGSAQTLSAGAAAVTTSTLAVGAHSITAVYSGDSNFTGSTSAVLAQSIVDFNFTISGGGTVSQTITPGQAATYSFTVQPASGSFNYPVVLSATGLPPGATAVFVPPTITLGSSPVSFTMTIQTSGTAQLLQHRSLLGGMSLALLLLPFGGTLRRGRRKMRPLLLAVLLLLSAAAVSGLTGCGSGSGYFGSALHTYNIQVIGTATGTGGATLQHSTTVTLTVQ